MAERCRADLDIPRDRAAGLGRSAVAATQNGSFISASGKRIDWSEATTTAIASTVSIAPEAPLPAPPATLHETTEVQVSNETTLAAARRLTEAGRRPLALNFANGVHPGGGFLNGARAQEETLCRSSALYATLVGDRMYAHHQGRPTPDSTSWSILSPRVPVFRVDDGTALEDYWLLDFLTCAAPYAPTVGRELSADLLAERIVRVLAIARAWGYDTLVLGAWGCGAFENDSTRTARDFRRALETEFRGAFSHIAFAITDWSAPRHYLGPFRDAFQS
jgi:uncharacterized protein (TIGR02452 family)